jgi:hypothetical protein
VAGCREEVRDAANSALYEAKEAMAKHEAGVYVVGDSAVVVGLGGYGPRVVAVKALL